jgi:hypothetical protein
VILLAGGTKRLQDEAKADAKARSSNYKARKARARKEGRA